MGLFNKLKNVLFEEEEIEEEVNDTVDELPKEDVVFEEVREYKPIMPEHKDLPKVKEPVFEKVKTEEKDYSERELFKSEPTFKFPAFDEDEFNTSMPDKKEEEEKRFSNTMELDRRKREERRNEYSRLDAVRVKEDVKEEKKRFKPSPVISPVYGILDKDYKADDIIEATPNGGTILTNKDLDVDSVRAKAFGKLKNITDEKKKEKPVIVQETYEIKKEVKKEEPVKEEKQKEDKIEEMLDDVVITSEPIIEDSSKLMEERTKTIDELLKDASDEVIDVTDDITESLDLTEEYKKLENEIDDALDLTSHIEPLVEDEEENSTRSSKKKEKSSALENDTLENDLYDLIDSMYDNTEDGE